MARRPASWLLRLAIGVLVFLVCGAAAWLTFDWYATRQLRAAQAHYQAMGQLVTVEDFAYPPTDDEENSSIGLFRAAAELDRSLRACAVHDWSASLDTFPFCEDERATLAPLQSVFAKVDEALLRPKTDWGIRLRTPVFDQGLPHLGGQRTLGKMSGAAARVLAAQGDHAGSLKCIARIDGIADRVMAPQPFMVDAMVAASLQALETGVIEEVLPILDWSDAEVRSLARRLVARLLDERAIRAAWNNAMLTERLAVVDASTRVLSNNPKALESLLGISSTGWAPSVLAFGAPALGPFWRIDGVWQLHWMEQVRSAFAEPNYPKSAAQLPALPQLSGMATLVRWPSSVLLMEMRRPMQIYWRTLTQRRLAAIAIAIKLYEADYGVWPAELSELTPEYLPSVPLDGFDPLDGPIRYAPAAPFPAIYSVGEDGQDDGGPNKHGYWFERSDAEILFGLRGRPESSK